MLLLTPKGCDLFCGEPTAYPGWLARLTIWTIPILLLISNTFGSFSDRRICIDILIRFLRNVGLEQVSGGGNGRREYLPYHLVWSWDDYFDSVMWMGAMHTFRLWKALGYWRYAEERTHSSTRNVGLSTALALAGFFPAVVSALASGLIIWYAVPSGFSCRHSWILGVFFLWVVSSLVTNGLYFCARGSYHWWIVFTKDLFVFLCTAGLPMASTVGAFNTCRCQNSEWRSESGYVPVGVEDAYRQLQSTYIIIIIVSQALQLGFYFAVIVWWLHGIKVVRWSEKRIRKEWDPDRQEWSLVLAYYLRLTMAQPLEVLLMQEQLRSGRWQEPATELQPMA